MNVAFVIFRAEPQRGGAERYARDLSQALIARGHGISVLATRFGVMDGTTNVRIGAGGVSRTSKYHRFLANVDKHLAANRYDVVHAYLPIHRCDVYHAHAGLETISLRSSHLIRPTLRGQTLAMIGNQLNPKRRAFARVEADLLNASRPPFTLCLSNRERDEAVRLFPASRGRLLTLYSTPDESRFDPRDLPARRTEMRRRLGVKADQSLFVFVGQDFERKGLATAIRALGTIKDPRALLFVVGGGDAHAYSQIALRADACGRVMFAGPVTNVDDYLAAADGLILPTRYEPFGMVVVEAMLMGVPPIVSAVAGASEVVEDGRNGFVIDDVNEVSRWADAMRQLLDPATRRRMSDTCLSERGRFSYQAHVDTIEDLYRRSAGGR